MRLLKTIFLGLALCAGSMLWAQEEEQENSLEGGTIESQFEFLYRKSGNYNAEGRRYEVVRRIQLDKIRDNILDSLNKGRAEARELNATIARQEGTIEDLNGKLENTTNQLADITAEKDSMSLIGMQVSKITYNLVLWTIIGGLLLFLLLFIYKYRRSNVLTQEAKVKLSDVESEYEDHRRKALEREQKISRQLQDEINKYKKGK
ncbi:tRNA (guanine-N1)-methyltransferase [Robiginitalea aurantiaca]|uniref:tRNA (Guanine-N1)-methyltransferase n=1 Tax=Robiginitalea aurantiaca TaxID=3056915 RepID=A0ABT7WGC5_9FLAO|nr:tRNA (guanine-N1)-methyltransferase [Robiginitalea aurantiaca]MDM9631972.1 tRNA (guanine-N1)-methyltransferase [Robiginitalea aurantiaca]